MSDDEHRLDRFYLSVVLVLMVVLPIGSAVVELAVRAPPTVATLGKWFVFWAVGARLFTAGVRQVAKPEFTARTIFHATSTDSFVIVRELGYSNLCLGTLGLVSIGVPEWRAAAALIGGLYFGLAGAIHVVKRPAGPNEVVAMISDLWVAGLMIVLFALLR